MKEKIKTIGAWFVAESKSKLVQTIRQWLLGYIGIGLVILIIFTLVTILSLLGLPAIFYPIIIGGSAVAFIFGLLIKLIIKEKLT